MIAKAFQCCASEGLQQCRFYAAGFSETGSVELARMDGYCWQRLALLLDLSSPGRAPLLFQYLGYHVVGEQR